MNQDLQKVPAGNQQINLFPLGFLIDAVAFLHGGETALGRQGNVVTDYGLCLQIAALEIVVAFKNRVFGGNQSGHKGGVGALQSGPRCKGTGSLVIIFDKVAVIGDARSPAQRYRKSLQTAAGP